LKTICIKKYFTILFFLFAAGSFFAQEKDQTPEKHKPSVMLGVSELKFFGTIGQNSDLNPLLDARLGYFLTVEQRFGKVVGISLTGLYGKLAATDNSPVSHLNFQSQIMQGHLMLTFNFDKVMKSDPLVSPFINIGIGYMMFNSYADLTNAKGDTIHYWKDGSTRNLSENPTNVFSSKIIDRDYNYETKLKTNNVTGTLVIPVGAGLKFHFGKNWAASVGANYNICLTNWIDNSGKNGNSYLSANAGLQYEFKSNIKEKESVNYSGVDFAQIDHLDADKDGVQDDKDNCLGTPTGVTVDANGCPIDTDKDGVPDYLDKEANTVAGAKVDGYGVTINEKDIIKHQQSWNDLAPERSKEFNVAPSKAYLDKVEAERARQGNKKRAIPSELKVADFNHDGKISAAEITQVINSFFDGNNDVSIDLINKLIEFFFE
jgi:hypothetical protein